MQSGNEVGRQCYAARRGASRANAQRRWPARAAASVLCGLVYGAPAAFAAPAPAPDRALAARASLRLPLLDAADPLPWPVASPNAALGGSRADLMGGLALSAARPAELTVDVRWSPYGLLLTDQQVVFRQRLTAELGGMLFVGEHVTREGGGMWSGGFVDLRVGGELMGRREPGDPPMVPATAHAALGYRKELGPGAAASLSIGGGAVLDPQQWTGGLLVLVTVLSERAL